MKNINDFLLTRDITVGQARNWMKVKDEEAKKELVKLIHHRFVNRYVKHLKGIDSGFLKMAVSCLMIETLESFKQGKKDTEGISKKMFLDFFTSEEKLFPEFKIIASEFYKRIRCGILHQAETTKAWRIIRNGALLDRTERVINATRFVNALDKALDKYIQELKSADFNSQIWENALLKIEDICENCNP
ncbi:MAG: hypothetical protein WC833_13895 [Bacteroidales bacterium]|jgi:hypothetical protein